MAIWGFGYKYEGGTVDKSEDFISKGLVCSGWGKTNEYVYQQLKQIKIGDIIFLKTYDKGGYKLRIKAIGIVKEKPNIQNNEELGSCIKVEWIKVYSNPMEISVKDSVPHIRTATLYEELTPEICKKVVEELLTLIKGEVSP